MEEDCEERWRDGIARPAPSGCCGGGTSRSQTTGRATPSLNDLMARLGHLDAAKKTAEVPAKAADAPKYCPQVAWKKAMDLLWQSATPAAGAHRKQIAVAFRRNISTPSTQTSTKSQSRWT